jgi:hypothetical protein
MPRRYRAAFGAAAVPQCRQMQSARATLMRDARCRTISPAEATINHGLPLRRPAAAGCRRSLMRAVAAADAAIFRHAIIATFSADATPDAAA